MNGKVAFWFVVAPCMGGSMWHVNEGGISSRRPIPHHTPRYESTGDTTS